MSTLQWSEPTEGVVQLTLNRPDSLNAINAALVEELHGVFDRLGQRPPSCRAVILTGSGRGFCSGLDLGGYGSAPGGEGLSGVVADLHTQRHIAGLVLKLRSLPIPVIAAVNGPATGGGLALALASDIRVASPEARFSAAFVRIGLSGCDIGVSWLLPRVIGTSYAFELMLTGRIMDADEAKSCGLVSRVVPSTDLIGEALRIADAIKQNSPFGIEMTKEVMWSQLEVSSLQAGIDLENRTQTCAAQTADFAESIQAFLGKRAPVFGYR